ncbi:MAG: DUF1508 domain-containing protein [bacterium]|nr:DUF1508 domain-containing protein [bacterium]
MASKNRIEIGRAKNREFFLTFKSGNNKKVMTSGETYKSKQGVEKALKSIKKIIKNPVVVDKTKAVIKNR